MDTWPHDVATKDTWHTLRTTVFAVAQVMVGETPPETLLVFALNDRLIMLVEGETEARYEATDKGRRLVAEYAMSACKREWDIPF